MTKAEWTKVMKGYMKSVTKYGPVWCALRKALIEVVTDVDDRKVLNYFEVVR